MAALDKLPYETLGQILSALSNADLTRTSLVSRRLCAASELLIYEAPCLTTAHSGVQRSSLDRFLKTLISSSRGTLGSHVRSLSVKWDHHSTLDSVTLTSTGPTIDLQGPTDDHSTQCVSLLHLLPSVQVLHISTPPFLPHSALSYFTRFIEHLDRAPRAGPDTSTFTLQSLREFSCSVQHNTVSVSVRAVLALMKLPCIDSIHANINEQPSDYLDRMTDNCTRFSTVTKLRLSWVTCSHHSLSVLVNAPMALTHFSHVAVGYTQFHMVDFMETLSPLQPTLQHLHLDLVRVSISFTRGKKARLRSSLRAWPVLETLTCSVVELLGNGFTQEVLCFADVLPRSLRALQILQDRYWLYEVVVDTVMELLLRKQEAVPVLDRVCVRTGTREVAEAYATLGVACEKAGVRLVGEDSFCW